MNRTARFGAGGIALAAACAGAVMIPAIASGGARNAIGKGKAEAAASTPYLAMLTGANEVGGGDTDGEGAAAVTLDTINNEVCIDLRVANLDTVVAAHIHKAPAGTNGPVVVPPGVSFTNLPAPTSSNCVAVDPTLLADIVANPANYYVNVHTSTFTGGAIRGQLAPSASTSGRTQLLNEPLRAYDSRNVPAGKVKAGETRSISVATGVDGAGVRHIAVPPGATGALLRVTLAETEGAGWLKVYSNALTTAPAASSVNWYEPGAIVGADPLVAVDAAGLIKVTAGFGATQVVIDVVGYIF
jgi:CHRD domain